MFLVSDTSESRETRIQQLLSEEPPLAALLSVIHFEWTLRRSIIALGISPNVEVRKKLEGCHGNQRYKQLWKEEVFPRVGKRLPEVINNTSPHLRISLSPHQPTPSNVKSLPL